MTSTPIEVTKKLKQLLRDPKNQVCADCKLSSHPRWSSWSLGLMICIKCAGIHRSLGTHISKVKSVDLDSWNDENLDKLIQFRNNSNANLFYECNLPVQPTGLDDSATLAEFIRDKYVLKKWVGDQIIISTEESVHTDITGETVAESEIPIKTRVITPVLTDKNKSLLNIKPFPKNIINHSSEISYDVKKSEYIREHSSYCVFPNSKKRSIYELYKEVK
ncbi:hypothetical protein KAFR_0L00790 [Kazachstania africana CBS 2517]|uniref:Arf-GAP domain-containing protein n=1 Tax=Kazachstania africana (strain ATCC 22294 / BCRC 22015 / CBS 2517 / CECT 1963 / NBRC 1671 / NRRL Y-8276) TaxID=1071382 RepID=H2B236_KAZAF|nr:hypothetical protein KAFR_0L00790 [Kazachstania africana CBS 2517]CCF60686.1 hypothetical protein KAFR_0L00790 [Kazachstania africana CBS 2517]